MERREKKPRGRPWQPGQSGNPTGRAPPTVTELELRELCRAAAPEVVPRLIKIVKSGADRDAIRASEVLLDRGFGKPRQTIDAEVKLDADPRDRLAGLVAGLLAGAGPSGVDPPPDPAGRD